MTDSKQLHKSKIVTISRNLTTSGMDFSSQIAGVNFIPDCVVLRSLVLSCGATAVAAKIYTNLLESGHLGVIAAPANGTQVSNPNLHYVCKNGNGNYQFILQDASGAKLAAIADNPQLFMQLEFIRF